RRRRARVGIDAWTGVGHDGVGRRCRPRPRRARLGAAPRARGRPPAHGRLARREPGARPSLPAGLARRVRARRAARRAFSDAEWLAAPVALAAAAAVALTVAAALALAWLLARRVRARWTAPSGSPALALSRRAELACIAVVLGVAAVTRLAFLSRPIT